MRILLACRSFFAVLFSAATADRVRQALDASDDTAVKPEPAPKVETKPIQPPRSPTRSEALTLIAALQREARLLDIVQEPLGSYSDAQIGAAARDVLKNCAAVINRFFAPQPVLAQEEGSTIEVPSGYDPLRYRVVGSVAGEPPFRGKLVHQGWTATKCELPAWSGSAQSAMILAPVEVEI